jgi:hypothetical protein
MTSRTAYFLSICTALAAIAIPAHSQTVTNLTINKGARAELALRDTLSSSQSQAGDAFSATLKKPLYVNGKLLLDAGTEFSGRVVSLMPWSPTDRHSNIVLLLDAVRLPSGKQSVELTITGVDERNRDRRTRQTLDYEQSSSGYGRGYSARGNNPQANGRLLASTGTGAQGMGSVSTADSLKGGVLTACSGDIRLLPGTSIRIKFNKALTLSLAGQSGSQQEKK